MGNLHSERTKYFLFPVWSFLFALGMWRSVSLNPDPA